VQKKPTNMFEFFDFLNNKEACTEFLIKFRWANGITCPHCNSIKIYTLKVGYKCAANTCYKKFNEFTKTPLQNTQLELKHWYLAQYLLTTTTYGISSHQLAEKVGIRQATAWHLRHRIAEFFKKQFEELLSGVVELDEAVIGGRNQFRHWDKKFAWKKGEAGKDKTWVFGMVLAGERKVRLFVVPDRKTKTLKAIIEKHIKAGAIIITDDYIGYSHLSKKYNHKVVKIKDPKRAKFSYKTEDGFDTNRIEGLWTQLKRAYKGVYHFMSRKHLQRYCDEISFRYEHRANRDNFIFETLWSNIPNVVLRYDDLVEKKLQKAA
jgi:transposase-like protein/IS1 family transposase